MEPRERIIVPLDVDDVKKATALVQDLAPYVGCFKIGLEFIDSMLVSLITPSISGRLQAIIKLDEILQLFKLLQGKIFWDEKFDDIPNTIAGASRQIVKLGVRFFSVHASAGRESVRAAVINRGTAKVLGVTVLTSIDPDECHSIFGELPNEKVLRFARMLVGVGADGIVCSPQELMFLREYSDLVALIRITPGIQSDLAAAGDQKRIMTPAEAIRAGADHLVIGRLITSPPPEIGTSVDAAKRIIEEVTNVY